MITKEYLHTLFNYDQGKLLWKVAREKYHGAFAKHI